MRALPDLTLWGVGTSRTFRPHWVMYELGLPYIMKPIGPRTGETKTAEYTRLNPRQKVPCCRTATFASAKLPRSSLTSRERIRRPNAR
jgi:glutathione S-transferase